MADTMTECLKIYLEEQTKRDGALAGKYDAGRLNKCAEYVTEQARKHLGGKNGYVEDALVYKWARDFYLEAPHEEKEERSEEKPEVEVKPAVVEKRDEPDSQLSLFEV